MGLVLSIERCSLHDGPGIRTTVFLKGCPLACAWCHNPESQSANPELQWFESRCTYCGACVAACRFGVHTVDAQRKLHTINRPLCTHCGACVAACPADALKMAGSQMSVSEVMSEVEKDRCYYDESGGGLTLSGGEPLFQFDFAEQLLRECKQRGIHTCVETSGYVTTDRLARILPLVDLFLFDVKATGDALHRQLTGVDARPILSALELLDARAKPVILRCPLVPGINDSPEHLSAIAALARKHTNVQAVELMAYHDMARDKFRRIGRDYSLPQIRTAEEPVISQWIADIKRSGYAEVRPG